jgi:hypothetical protein
LRETTARQIAELATSGIEDADVDAWYVALYGRKLSGYESLCRLLLHYHRSLKMIRRKQFNVWPPETTVAELKAAENNFNRIKELVCEIFLQAVLDGDRGTILELANAADFFKDKLTDDFRPHDPERLKLLRLKNRGGVLRRRLTLRQIAEKVYEDKNIFEHHAADGFSSLRRKCKQLKIEIKPSRKIRLQ